MNDDAVRTPRAQVVMERCEAYRKELRDFTDSLPGIIAGNQVPTDRADLVKWQGGFKSAAHHLRLLQAEIERLRKVEGRALRVVTTSHDPACSRGDIDLSIEALAEVLGRD